MQSNTHRSRGKSGCPGCLQGEPAAQSRLTPTRQAERYLPELLDKASLIITHSDLPSKIFRAVGGRVFPLPLTLRGLITSLAKVHRRDNLVKKWKIRCL